MNDHDEFWKRVNAAVDERRDPLGDEVVQRLIGDEPGRLDELRRLERGLSFARRSAPTRPIVLALAAAVTVVLFGTWLAAREPVRDEARHAVREVCASRVLSFHISVSRVDERGTETITFDGVESTRTLIDRDGNVLRNSIHVARAETPGNRP